MRDDLCSTNRLQPGKSGEDGREEKETPSALAQYCGTSVAMIEKNYCGTLGLASLRSKRNAVDRTSDQGGTKSGPLPRNFNDIVVAGPGFEPGNPSFDNLPKLVFSRTSAEQTKRKVA